MSITKKVVLLFVLVPMVLMESPVPASAQSEPKATFPIAGSTVAGEIDVIRVEFNEPIDPTMSGLELRKGGTQPWIAGVGTGFCDTSSCQLLFGQLEPDSYTVVYDVFTPSGKVIKNQFTFTVGGTD